MSVTLDRKDTRVNTRNNKFSSSFLEKKHNMIIDISVARLNQCNSPPHTIPYGHVKIIALDAFVSIGDFIEFEVSDGTSKVGRMIDACMLDNTPVSELSPSIIDAKEEQDEKSVRTCTYLEPS